MAHPDLSMVRRLEAVEAAACRDLLGAAPPSFRCAALQIAGATLLVAPALPVPVFNRVIGLGHSAAATEHDLDDIAAAYRTAGVTSWWIHLAPGALPVTLERLLAARGYTVPPRRSWAKVVRGNALPAKIETALEIRALRAGEEDAFGQTLCAAYAMPASAVPWFARLAAAPGWRAVAAFDRGAMVGGGLLHLQGENAWLGAGGVRPDARGRHAHRALMTARIRLAVAAGCTHIATETGEALADEPNPSLHNMLACGFEKVYARRNFAAPAA